MTVKCGTYKGAQRHHRLGETVCEPCRKAKAEYMVVWRKKNRAKCRRQARERRLRSVPVPPPASAVPLELGEDWRAYGACKGVDPEIFYPSKGTGGTEVARQFCAPCPVRAQCLDDAMRTRDQFGVRAGLSPKERQALRRKQAAA